MGIPESKNSGMDTLEECQDKDHYLSYTKDISYRYNSRGFRDHEWPEDLSDVVWCVGDSFTVGIGQPFEETWPQLLGKKLGKISSKDIMVVAPYNAQANNIRERLKKKNDDVRVGTIDLFQGQEAKIVFISMTSSDPENIPRHKGFLFSRNRLNVAISRAQCVAIIIFNEKLLLASTNSIEEMKLMNNFCKLLKYKNLPRDS